MLLHGRHDDTSNGGPWRVRWRLVWLFAAAFFVYNANLREVSSYDTMSTRYLPISLLTSGDLNLDEFSFFFRRGVPSNPFAPPVGPKADRTPYWVQYTRGQYISTFPVAPALLATPVYALPAAAGLFRRAENWELLGTLLSKVSASLAAAGSVVLVYLMLRRLSTPGGALWATLTYAFGTSTWAVSSQGLWQVAMSQPCTVAALYGLLRARSPAASRFWWAFAGFFFALSVSCRPPNLLLALVFTAYVCHRHRARLPLFLAGPALIGAALVSYNAYFFGNLQGGYADTGVGSTLVWPTWNSLGGLLLSPSRGVFILSPVLLFALVGGWRAIRDQDEDGFWRYSAAAVGLLIAFYACWRYWHGHHSYGYRHLIDILPILALWLGVGMQSVLASSKRRAAFILAFAGSVGVQFIGAFFYPCGWEGTPVSAFTHQERLWSFSDPQVVRCALAGPIFPDGLALLTHRPRRPRF